MRAQIALLYHDARWTRSQYETRNLNGLLWYSCPFHTLQSQYRVAEIHASICTNSAVSQQKVLQPRIGHNKLALHELFQVTPGLCIAAKFHALFFCAQLWMHGSRRQPAGNSIPALGKHVISLLGLDWRMYDHSDRPIVHFAFITIWH